MDRTTESAIKKAQHLSKLNLPLSISEAVYKLYLRLKQIKTKAKNEGKDIAVDFVFKSAEKDTMAEVYLLPNGLDKNEYHNHCQHGVLIASLPRRNSDLVIVFMKFQITSGKRKLISNERKLYPTKRPRKANLATQEIIWAAQNQVTLGDMSKMEDDVLDFLFKDIEPQQGDING